MLMPICLGQHHQHLAFGDLVTFVHTQFGEPAFPFGQDPDFVFGHQVGGGGDVGRDTATFGVRSAHGNGREGIGPRRSDRRRWHLLTRQTRLAAVVIIGPCLGVVGQVEDTESAHRHQEDRQNDG